MPPVYEYLCDCGSTWDVTKRIADLDCPETCRACGGDGKRQIARFNFNGAADWNNQQFHPALGRYVKSNAEARKIAKAAGMEEVGNEPPEKIHQHYDRQREETREQRWRDASREKLYD